jgi:hypothetical protein
MAASEPAPAKRGRVLQVAVQGCTHGELDAVYDAVRRVEEVEAIHIDLVICCGDFQAVRNPEDLETMKCPLKYRGMNTFFKYYSGERVAPKLTLFVGGNHEASNHLQELPFGGWVAPNIFFLGHAGVVRFRGLRIGGLSGIFQRGDFFRPRAERPPYTERQITSVYHQRIEDVARLLQLRAPMDVFVSHDWPVNVVSRGRWRSLKRHFMSDIHSAELGSPATALVMRSLRPRHWFSAHLHTKYTASVPHFREPLRIEHPHRFSSVITAMDAETAAERERIRSGSPVDERPEAVTLFLALDKPIPGRESFQVVPIHVSDDVSEEEFTDERLFPDYEWFSVVAAELGTHEERTALAASKDPQGLVRTQLGGISPFPAECPITVSPYCPSGDEAASKRVCCAEPGDGMPRFAASSLPPWGYVGPRVARPPQRGNPQTDAIVSALRLDRSKTNTVPYVTEGETVLDAAPTAASALPDDNEIEL